MKINWSFIEPVRDQAARLRGDFSVQSEIVKLAEQQREIAQLQNDIEYLKYKVLSLADALMPFANSADWKYGKYVWDTLIVAGVNKDDLQINLTLKDFRMAQMLIEKIDEEINKRKPK